MEETPTYGPQWATDNDIVAPGSDPSVNPVIAPTTAKRATGFGVEPLPYQTVNALLAEHGDWLAHFRDRFEVFGSLQDYIEAANIVDSPGASGELYPGLVVRTETAGGRELDSVALGDLGTFGDDTIVHADGRFVCVVVGSGTVRVYNAKDLTLFKTITTSVVPSTPISAVVSDSFRMAIAYDGKVEMHLIDEATTLDSTWATSGVYTHDTAGAVNALVLVNRALFIGGNAAAGTGDTPAGHSFVALEADGSGLTSFGVAASAVVQRIKYWTDNILVLSDSGVSPVKLYAADFSTRWAANFDDDWNSVSDVAVNDKYVAVAGLRASATDPCVRVYHRAAGGEIGAFVFEDRDWSANGWTFQLAFDFDRLYVVGNPNDIAVAGVVKCYDPRSAGERGFARCVLDPFGGTLLRAEQNVASATKAATGDFSIDIAAELVGQLPAAEEDLRVLISARGQAPASSRHAHMTGYTAASGTIEIDSFDYSQTAADALIDVEVSWPITGAAICWEMELAAGNSIPVSTGFDLETLFVSTWDNVATGDDGLVAISIGAPKMRLWHVNNRNTDEPAFSAMPLRG